VFKLVMLISFNGWWTIPIKLAWIQ
jgi:hypothetical protein